MFENIKNIFKKNKKRELLKSSSKDMAKERLHLVLMQDRANVSADFLDLMRKEIIEVIKKYIDIDEKAIDVRLTTETTEDGGQSAPALYANIPIINIKDEARNLNKENKIQIKPKTEETNQNIKETKEDTNKQQNDEIKSEKNIEEDINNKTENSENNIEEDINHKTENKEEVKQKTSKEQDKDPQNNKSCEKKQDNIKEEENKNEE